MDTVLITGAASTLGQVFACNFAANGWNVILHGFQSQQRVEALAQQVQQQYGVAVLTVFADLTAETEVAAMVEHICQWQYAPTVLVNNAAAFPSPHTVLSMPQQQWEYLWRLNVGAVRLMAQHFVASLAPEGGRIVNVASLGGLEIWRQRGGYNLTKQAVIRLTQILAVELAPRYVVNAVAPGVIGDPAKIGLNIAPERIPMQRWGTPQDVWEAVYFFATCSPYITGQCLVVDGGFHLAKGCG